MAKLDRPARRAPSRAGRGAGRATGSSRSTPTRPRRIETAPRLGPDPDQRHRLRQVALASTCRCSTGSRTSRSGARSTSTRPRRSPRTRRESSASCARRACARRSTTATPRARSGPAIRRRAEPGADQPRHAQRRASSPTTSAGATSSPTSAGSSSTRRTPTAGVFGSHVANVLRRLRRIARLYGAEPRFVLASATIANPGELAERLTGPRVRAARRRRRPAGRPRDRDVEPAGDRASRRRPGARRSPRRPTCSASWSQRGVRTICFMKSRRGIELINRFASMKLDRGRARATWPTGSPPTAPATRPSSGARSRPQLARGELLAVAATNALELGIDVGELDAAICVNFPGTVASLRQMWGRAGRRRRGLAVYVAGEDALDQFFCRHPDEFLGRPVEAAILDHRSEQIQMQHLVAAAYEAPLGGVPSDDEILGEGWREGAERLVDDGRAAPGPRRPLPDPQRRLRRRAASRCARPRPTASPSSTRPRARCSATSRPSAPSRRSTPAPSTCTWGAPTRSPSWTCGARAGDRAALRRRLLHAGEEGDRGLRRGDADHAAARWGSSSASARSRSPSR